MFANRSAVWVNLEPLNISAVSNLVSRTLHRSKDDCAPLSRVIHAASLGNPFSVRSIVTTMYRAGHITFVWDKNHWQYVSCPICAFLLNFTYDDHWLTDSPCLFRFDLQAVETAIIDKIMVADPSNLSHLVSHLRGLPEDARKYITWASFFGAT